MTKGWKINDEVLFSCLDINDFEKCSFDELITKVSKYVYDDLELDARFGIETWLKELLEREMFLSITKKRHRDHLLHACRIAILGEKVLTGKITYQGRDFELVDLVRELLKEQPKTKELFENYESEITNDKILQIWYIAALFHDVGFIYDAFTEVWGNIQSLLKDFPNFKDLYLNVEAAITNFQKEFSVSDVHKRLCKAKFTREFDHSKIGACLISNLVGESNVICDTAAYITDHHTSNEILKFTERPLSFLLTLLDEIQEWERPAIGKKMREQALLEKISKFSPYIERTEPKPELNSITLSSDSDKGFEKNIKDNGNLDLNFTLDYEDKRSLLDVTDFSFPMMLYLKYKNLQRLRIGEGNKIKKCLKKVLEIGDDRSDSQFNFLVSLNFLSKGDLYEKWIRQSNMLLLETSTNNNIIINKWLENILEHVTEGGITFQINEKYMPRVLSGDFRDVIMKSHEIYLRDEYISRETIEAKIIYEKNDDETLIKVLTTVKQKLKNNSDPKTPIFGFFVSFGEDVIKSNAIKVTEDDMDITDRIQQSKIPKRGGGDHRENFLMFIRFDKPLYETKDIEYEVELHMPSEVLSRDIYTDHIYNIRRNYDIKEGNLIVKWHKELFNKFFGLGGVGGISFDGTQDEIETLRENIPEIMHGIRDSKYNEFSDRYLAYRGLHRLREDNKEYYSFTIDGIKNIKPYHSAGFMWIPKKKMNRTHTHGLLEGKNSSL